MSPDLSPASSAVSYCFARRYGFPLAEVFRMERVKEIFIDELPTFSPPVIILGGVFGGFVTACSIARANIWEVSKIDIYFIAVLMGVLMLTTYVPAVPMFLVEYFYR